MGEQLTEKLGLPDEGASSGGWAGTPPSSLSGIAGWSAALLTRERGRGTRSALPRAPAAPVPRGHRRAVVLGSGDKDNAGEGLQGTLNV